MAYTQTELDALRAAIAEGVLKVEYGDKKVEYRSLNEMIRIKKMMEAELEGLPAEKRTYASHSKGTHPNDC